MYRMMFVSLTLGLGIWKAVASYRDQEFTLNTLDWVIGTALALTYGLVAEAIGAKADFILTAGLC